MPMLCTTLDAFLSAVKEYEEDAEEEEDEEVQTGEENTENDADHEAREREEASFERANLGIFD